MTPSDPRHGTYAGYVAKCRCDDCREAARRYQARLKWDLHNGRTRSIDSTPTRRKIQALIALGWDLATIARMLGTKHSAVHRWANSERVYRTTAAKVDAIYRRLSMTIPPTETSGQRIAVSRAKAIARRRGFAPPLAWTNIDDPNDRPSGAAYTLPSNIACGTDAGYQRHRRQREDVCPSCQDAHRDKRRAERASAAKHRNQEAA